MKAQEQLNIVKNEEMLNFLKENSTNLSKQIDLNMIKATILSTKNDDIQKAATQIQNGELVAFPTETVYGLGANALDEKAVLKIYQAKRRPLTDPVIVHVTSKEQALSLVSIDKQTEEIFNVLVDKFWPGPLTIILKANLDIIPNVVTAQTGFVGVRFPKTKIAQDLINISKRPIAAPSANLFSHVSPTSPVHVFNDLYDKEMGIINGGSCEFGIESTVIKLEKTQDGELKILVLRNGSLSEKMIKDFLESEDNKFSNVEVYKKQKEKSSSVAVNSEAPGQLLKHYSPYHDTYLVNFEKMEIDSKKIEMDINLDECALIDFSEFGICLKNYVCCYINLSTSGNFIEAMHNLYDSLRKAENQEKVKKILISNIDYKYDASTFKGIGDDYFETVYDKLYRSSSGNKISYCETSKYFYL